MTDEQKEWYNNKQLYEMMVDLSKGLENTNAELTKTQTLIRDYNGLRTVINQCREWQNNFDRQQQVEANRIHFGWEKMGYVVGALGVVVAIVALVV